MFMSAAPSILEIAGLARERAVAEFREYAAMKQYRDTQVARVDAMDASPMRKLIERSAIAVELAQAIGLSEGQVVQRLAMVDRVFEHAPRVWVAFRSGRVDAVRVREISFTIDKLQRPESRRELDTKAVAYAQTHTLAELRRWLRRFITRVEADAAIERANTEHAKRHVNVVDADDGMAWLNAYLPAHQAAAIRTRLRHEARTLGSGDGRTRDDRTLEQRQADVLVEHLLQGPAATGKAAGLKIDIAITLDAKILTGLNEGHAEAADGSWEVPAAWILNSALVGESFWHRLLVDPIIGDTLAHQYNGYATPDILRRAITFRDGVCATPGCLRPANECDIDHQEPWPHGPTTGPNLNPRCRADHARKGHGFLPRILHAHTARARPPHRTRHRHEPPDPSHTEDHLARLIADH